MWDEETGEHSPCFWGRGNGWVAMSYVEVLQSVPADSPNRPRLVDAYRKLLAALAPLQDRQSGLWHTVLDDPASYGETSASAMILYSMIEGRKMRLLDAAYDEPIQRGWAALSTQVNNMGQVTGVSAGTGPGDRASYLARPQGTYPWGTGAMLMAASALGGGGAIAVKDGPNRFAGCHCWLVQQCPVVYGAKRDNNVLMALLDKPAVAPGGARAVTNRGAKHAYKPSECHGGRESNEGRET